MRYKAVFVKSFVREFKRLPDDVKERILEGVRKVSGNPYEGIRLRGQFKGLWRFRVGKYRLIYVIDEKNKRVVFVDIGLRKAIYK